LGLTPDDLDPRLRHLERLNALGLDLEAADTLATALDATGLVGEQRAEVVRRLPEIASLHVEIDQLRAAHAELMQVIRQLTAACDKDQEALKRGRKRVASLSQQERTLTERSAALQRECLRLQDAIVAARALETFLLTSIDLAHPIWRLLDQVRAFRERRPGLPPGGDVLLTHAVKQEVARFLERIASMPPPSPPALAP
jgi:chromosome segregation ATPase